MRTTTTIAVLAALALLVAPSASAESDFETAKKEFTCEPPEEREAVKDDMFDEQELPDSVTASFGRAGAGGLVDGAEGDDDDSAEDPDAEPVHELAAATDEELQAYRDAVTRYEDRALEFANEVNRIIRRQYFGEVVELRDGYERLIGKADLEERQLRDAAIDAHERFVRDHVASPYTARRMFRLAELYFEKSEEEYIAANERYDELVDLFDDGKLDFLPEPPQKDLRRSIALYKKIIKKFPDYGELGVVYYTLGYCYSDETSRHLDAQRAEATYLELLENVEESPYRAQAYFRLGDLYFEENQHESALYYYRSIVDEFEEAGIDVFDDRAQERLYELALYKLAWAYYKVDDLPTAITRFMTLLDWAERKEARTGKEADLKPESIRYLAVSFSDLAIEEGASPIGYASSAMRGREETPWSFEVMVELAGILKDQARFEEAIEAYTVLQRRQPFHPMGPDFQNNIVVLYQNLVVPDPDAAADARVELTNRYGLESDWYAANKNNKEATALATKYILESLQWVAYAYHTKAQETDDPADYLLAARKYIEYLERYPFADNAYELNYNLADCYFWIAGTTFPDEDGNQVTGWEMAIEQYASLFGFPETDHKKDAILGIMFSYNYLWKRLGGDVTKIPEALANIAPPLGQKVEFSTVPVTELEKNYARSVRWVQRDVPEYEGLAVLLFDIGQIYYFKNHLTRARTTFMELIEEHPGTNYAGYGAGLIVDSYRYTGDLARMRDATERFAMLQLGEDPEVREERAATFGTLAKKSLFKDGELAYGFERYECALLSFLEYYELYGSEGTDTDPQDIDDIVYNTALSYSKVGRAEDSTRYYELLLERFPHSEQAPKTFWKMAQNYEQLFELDKAVKYYEDLMEYHSEHEDVPNALYNSGFLAIGLERFAAAARAYEEYHDTYTDKEESPLLLFRAAELWEADGDVRQASRVYTKWMDEYGETDADRWVETQWKLAGFERDAGRTRDADRRVEAIAASYENLRPELTKDGGSVGLKITAGIAFEPLIAEYEAYAEYAFPDTDDQEKLQEAFDRKVEWNGSVAAALDAFVVEYPDFEWQTAALYYKALSYQDHGITWINAPNPFDPDSDDPDIVDLYYLYQDKLLEKAQPWEDSAVLQYKAVVDFAKQKKRYTVWVGKALEELNRVDPNTFPVPKPESTTVIESDSASTPSFIEEVETTSARPQDDDGIRYAGLRAAP